MLPGRATAEGTARFRDAAAAATGHFRETEGLWLSSLGIGTYLGRDDAKTDALYAASIRRSLRLGLNVVDTAINYRNQRSERAVGAALRENGQQRDGILLCTKGGYLAFDGGRPHDARAYVEETFLRAGILQAEDIVAGCHSLAPRFLQDQIDRSRGNLGVAGDRRRLRDRIPGSGGGPMTNTAAAVLAFPVPSLDDLNPLKYLALKQL